MADGRVHEAEVTLGDPPPAGYVGRVHSAAVEVTTASAVKFGAVHGAGFAVGVSTVADGAVWVRVAGQWTRHVAHVRVGGQWS